MLRAICRVKLKDRKQSKNLMLMLGWNGIMDQLTMASSVRWWGYVLRRGDGHVLIRALDFEVRGRSKLGESEEDVEKEV